MPHRVLVRVFPVAWSLAFAMAWGVGLAATPARAQLQLQQAAQDDASTGPDPLPLSAWITLTQSVGSGTFAVGPNNPTTATTLSLTPMLMMKGWQVLLNQSFGFEWTSSDSTTYKNQVEMSDLSIGVRNMNALRIEEADLVVWPSVGAVVPLSLASRHAGSAGTLTGGARVNWSGLRAYGLTIFGGLNGGYRLLVPGLANRLANVPVRPLDERHQGPIAVVSCNVRNAQELLNYACSDGQVPSAFNWGTSVGFWWFSLLDGALGITFNVGYTQAFSARIGPDDEYTPDNAVPGLVPRQSTSGDIALNYNVLPWLSLSLGFGSSQPFLTADGKGVRFPLWDFVSPHNNFSAAHFDATFIL